MNHVGPVGAFPITRWFVLFYDCTAPNDSWLARNLPFGRFRHASALGKPMGLDLWVWFDVSLHRTRVELIPAAFDDTLAELVQAAAEVVSFPVLRGPPRIGRLGYYCVPSIKHLLGLRGCALTPDGLYRLLIENGGERFDEHPSGPGTYSTG
jgi:hypothetical protein